MREGRSVRRRWWFLALTLLLAAALVLTALDMRMRPLVREYSVNRAQVLASEAMTRAVNTVLAGGGYQYDTLIAVSRDENGAVQSVETDAAAVNRLSTAVVSSLSETLAQEDFSTLRLPLMNATGSAFWMGRGPKITMRIQQSGAAAAQMTSTFSAAGINQTVHRLELTLTFRAVVLVAGMSEPIETSGTFLVAETVIVGAVPDVFANIHSE